MSYGQLFKKTLCIAFLFGAVHCQGAIFGDGDQANGIEDDRHRAPAHLLNAVGTIFCDGRLRGTGTHIDVADVLEKNLPSNKKLSSNKTPLSKQKAPSIIVTAAHVLFNRTTGLRYRDCSYRPGNKRLGGIPFDQVSNHAYQPLAKDKMRQSETDIVFVSLQHRIYRKGLSLALQVNPYGLQLLAYNPGAGRIDTSGNCQSYESANFRSKDLLLHNCDAESGASGGPLLEMINNKPLSVALGSVVAIHGGTFGVLSNRATNGQANTPTHSLFDEAVESADGTASAYFDRASGAKAQPEQWINQARRVDRELLQRLQDFVAYLGKGSAD